MANINSDLALVHILVEKKVAYLPLALPNEVTIGTEVFAIGSPKSLNLSHSISKGIISGLRVINDITLIQTDAPLNPGNSGGPLINERGECFGTIVSKIIGSGIEGLGFAVSSQDVVKSLKLRYVD